MTQTLTAAIDDATTHVEAVDDPVERYHAARRERALIAEGDARLKVIQREVVVLLREGRTWSQVGELLGISGSRAEAIARVR